MVHNVAEAAIAITAGLLAGLVSLVGFGLDSGIESAASVLVGLRLAARLRNGEADEAKERRTLKAVAVTFFVLGAYVIFKGVRSLIGGEEPDISVVGLVLLAASVVIMPVPAAAKKKVAMQLGGDQLILADAAETRICVLLSISTIAGLGLYAVTGAAWLDPYLRHPAHRRKQRRTPVTLARAEECRATHQVQDGTSSVARDACLVTHRCYPYLSHHDGASGRRRNLPADHHAPEPGRMERTAGAPRRGSNAVTHRRAQ